MTIRTSLAELNSHFNPDANDLPVIALRLEVEQNTTELPVHQHRKGQLVVARHGAVTCKVPRALWLVPPQHAVWIPGGMPHSNLSTHNARISYLFVEPDVIPMPEECCTLALTPLVRELIEYAADQEQGYPKQGIVARTMAVLLEHLSDAPVAELHLPVSEHPKIAFIADSLTRNPADRTTLEQWASATAMSNRTLARLIKSETGLTFGRWRQQIHLLIALRQLSSGASVQQVAGELGYDASAAFTLMFRKALGKPPTQYFADLYQEKR